MRALDVLHERAAAVDAPGGCRRSAGRRRAGFGLRLLGVAALVALGSTAGAAPRPVALRFEDGSGEPGCADEAALRARVEDLVQGLAFDRASARRASVSIQRRGPGIRAAVRVLEGRRVLGDRAIDTGRGDCPALLASVALSLVLVIDPVRGLRLMGTPQAPVSSPPVARPVAVPAPPEPPPPAPPPAPARRWPPVPAPPIPTRLELDAGVLATVGATPGFGGGWQIGAAVRRPRWSVGLEARLQPPSTAPFAGGEVQAALAIGGARGCLHFGHHGLCGLALAGVQPVAGRGFARQSSARAEVAFVGARAFAGLAPLPHRTLPDWNLRLGLELLAPLGTTALRVDGRTAWRSPPVALGLGLAVVYAIR